MQGFVSLMLAAGLSACAFGPVRKPDAVESGGRAEGGGEVLAEVAVASRDDRSSSRRRKDERSSSDREEADAPSPAPAPGRWEGRADEDPPTDDATPAPTESAASDSGTDGLLATGSGVGGGGRASGAGDRRPSAPKKVARPARRPPPKSGVKAGAADDNVQFNAFLRFLRENPHGLAFPTAQRRIVRVQDSSGRPWPGARVELLDDGVPQVTRQTYADGRTVLFPTPRGPNAVRQVRVEVPGYAPVIAPLADRRALDITVPAARPAADEAGRAVPLDVAFVLDTTGSMQDEIDRLRATLNTINFQVTHARPKPDVRYGMVLYRDRGDAYRTEVVPFTRDLAAFSQRLGTVQAGGGDDYPEDVQAGLEAALTALPWRDRGVKLAFLIGDAPPHLDYGQRFTYLTAADRAASQGIKIATIGASGLDRTGEVVWRQLAQQTMAPFVFLTYGEKGDADGSPSSVSHHVGANWVADDLDAIVIRLVKHELSHWRPQGAPEREDYFIARPSTGVPAEVVLEELFQRSAQQLVDYAVEAIEPRTPTLLLPLRDADAPRGRMLERRLAVGLSRHGLFQLVENDQRAEMLAAIAKQMADAYDEARMIEVGQLVPARLAVLGAIDSGERGLELLVKLVRLETGEVLSLSLMRIDQALL